MSCLLVLLVFGARLSLGQVVSSGTCPPGLRGMEDFQPSLYLGRWYEYASCFELFEAAGVCVRATYTDESPNVGVFNEQKNSLSGGYISIKGAAHPTNHSAEYVVLFPVSFPTDVRNYAVVETDYTGYSFVYICDQYLGLFKVESLWLLTREQTPSAEFVQAAYSRMTELGLPVQILKETPQTDCDVLP